MKDKLGQVRFMFLRDGAGVPVAVVAFQRDTQVVRFGLSAWNRDSDDTWDREQGRLIAAGRLLLEPCEVSHDLPILHEGNMSTMRLIAQTIKTGSGFPTRAREGAKRWLRKSGNDLLLPKRPAILTQKFDFAAPDDR